MRKILVLGGGSDQISLIEELKRRGFYIVLIDYYPNPPAKPLADKHYVTSTLDVEQVLKLAQEEKVDYVISACIDQALLTMALVAEKLSLRCPFSFHTAQTVTNKAYMKEIMFKRGIPTAQYRVFGAGETQIADGLKFPVVVKPTDCNGSYGVKKANNNKELKIYLENAQNISRSGQAIVEEFRKGMEVSVDAFIKHGKGTILMMTTSKKIPDAGSGFPIYQSRYPAPIGDKARARIEEVVNQIAGAFGLNNTPLLVQIIIDNEEVSVIEFGARIAGGSKHHLISEITGFDVMRAYVDSFFNVEVEVSIHPVKDYVAMNYVYVRPGIFSRVENIDELRHRNIIRAYYMYKTCGMESEGYFASRDRICSFLVRGSSEAEMEEKIRCAVKEIRVLNEKNEDIMLREIYLDNQEKVGTEKEILRHM